MITYGLTMQGKPDKVPAEVAVWLFEHNDRYPNIKFEVGVWEFQTEEEAKKHAKMRQEYARLWRVRTKVNEPMVVAFPYPGLEWFVRIIGGLDENGNIVDLTKEYVKTGLTPELRRKIAEMPDDVELVSKDDDSWATVGVQFKNGDTPIEEPIEYIEIDPAQRWTSELTMSAAKIVDLVDGPQTERKRALVKAISEKDWENARRLLKQRH